MISNLRRGRGRTRLLGGNADEAISSLKPKVGKGTRIYPLAEVSPMAVIGKNCKVSTSARVGRCVIGEGSYIGFRAKIYNNVHLGKGCRIEKYAEVLPDSWLGDGVIVENGAKVQGIFGANVKVGAGSIARRMWNLL